MNVDHLSVRRAARTVGKSPTTIWAHRAASRTATDLELTSVFGLDGKQYPPHREYDLQQRDRLLQQLRGEGLTLRQIAERSGWSHGTCATAVRNAQSDPQMARL